MSSPTSRTLAVLRKEGLRCQVVERWVAQARRRVDLWGFIDIVAMEGKFVAITPELMIPADTGSIIGIQVCAGASHAARRTKILKDCRHDAILWLACKGKIQIRSWSKRKHKLKNGKKVDRWTERIEQITLEDFD